MPELAARWFVELRESRIFGQTIIIELQQAELENQTKYWSEQNDLTPMLTRVLGELVLGF